MWFWITNETRTLQNMRALVAGRQCLGQPLSGSADFNLHPVRVDWHPVEVRHQRVPAAGDSDELEDAVDVAEGADPRLGIALCI